MNLCAAIRDATNRSLTSSLATPACPMYFAERMAERLTGIDGVEVEVSHVAR